MSGNQFDIKFGYNKRSAAKQNLETVLQDVEGIPLVDRSDAPLVAEIEGFVTSELTSEKAVSVVLPTIPRVVSKFLTFIFGEEFQVSKRIVEGTTLLQDAYIRLINPEKTWQFLRIGFIIDAPTGTEIINPTTGQSEGYRFETFKIKNIVEEGFDDTGRFNVRIDLEEDPLFATSETRSVNYIRRILTKERIATLKIEEQFAATSEVSRSLLGIDRAETQLSLFSNVSTYGLNTDEFVFYPNNPYDGPPQWTARVTESGIAHYPARIEEVPNEGALALTAYPVPYTFPYSPLTQKVVLGEDIGGFYQPDSWKRWQHFLQLGKSLYEYFTVLRDSNQSSPVDYNRYDIFLTRFMPAVTVWDDIVHYNSRYYGNNNARYYTQVSIWTYAFELIKTGELRDPVTFAPIDFTFLANLAPILRGTGTNKNVGSGSVDSISNVVDEGPGGIQTTYNPFKETWLNKFWSEASIAGGVDTGLDDFRPGYSPTGGHFVLLQSRQAFRYQPGRISGYTFGTRATIEKNQGNNTGEWGIFNDYDEYVFKREGANFYLVRRSNIPYPIPFLQELGLADELGIEDPEYVTNYQKVIAGTTYNMQEIKIPREKFNGDSLNGNGPSGYLLTTDEITMYKIEFGWYGAIGLRFYAYIPVENGEARWVVVHTFVIENKLNVPSMGDPFFKFKYQLNIGSGQGPGLTQPQYLYKYGTSMYIDGGDEGTVSVYSETTDNKVLPSTGEFKSVLGIYPKDSIVSGGTDAQGNNVKIPNKKIIIPKQLSVTSDGFAEITVFKCKACKGSQFLYLPNIRALTTGLTRKLKKIPFEPTDTIELAPIDLVIQSKNFNSDVIYTTDAVNIQYLRPGDYILEDIPQQITQARIENITESGGTYSITLDTAQPGLTVGSTVRFQPSWIIGDADRRKYGLEVGDFEAKVLTNLSPGIYGTYIGNLVSGPQSQIINLKTRAGDPFNITTDRFLDPIYNVSIDYQLNLTPAEFFGDPNTETFDIRLSKLDNIAASPSAVQGPLSRLSWLNTITGDSGTYTEYEIGFTPNRPLYSVDGVLTGWQSPDGSIIQEDRNGVITNKIVLDKSQYVTAMFSPISIDTNIYGAESGEILSGFHIPLGSDFRIPNPPGSNSGYCSDVILEKNESLSIQVNQVSSATLSNIALSSWTGFADQTELNNYLSLSNFFLTSIAGNIVGGVNDPTGGQIAVLKDLSPILNFYIGGSVFQCRFAGPQREYTDTTGGQTVQVRVVPITIDIESATSDVGGTTPIITPGQTFVVSYTGVNVRGYHQNSDPYNTPESYTIAPTGAGIFDYNVFPMYPIVLMRDGVEIRSAEVSDVDYQDNTTAFNPTWKVSQKSLYGGTPFNTVDYFIGNNLQSGQINADGVGNQLVTPSDIDGLIPSAFQEVDRLSSAKIDRQGLSTLRPGDNLTTIYINNETKTFDLSDIFGSDRKVITPDIVNTEAVYFVARSLSGVPVELQLNITYVEQL